MRGARSSSGNRWHLQCHEREAATTKSRLSALRCRACRRSRADVGGQVTSTHYVAWWKLENLFDEEDSQRRTESPERRSRASRSARAAQRWQALRAVDRYEHGDLVQAAFKAKRDAPLRVPVPAPRLRLAGSVQPLFRRANQWLLAPLIGIPSRAAESFARSCRRHGSPQS
jgi:hypothetical protein